MDPVAALSRPVTGLRLGLVGAAQLPGVDEQVMQAVAAAAQVLRKLGATVEPIELRRQPIDAALVGRR
jgi:Asp-tRNA(Asn)/Glu-tRNA(Gln) amidotransferase A subunit family amidase